MPVDVNAGGPRPFPASRPLIRREVAVRFRLSLACSPLTTSFAGGLLDDLVEGPCGRRKCRKVPNCQHVAMYACLFLSFQDINIASSDRAAKRARKGAPLATRTKRRASTREEELLKPGRMEILLGTK